MFRWLQRLVRDEEGQGMVEYGLIIALVALAVIVILTQLGTELTTIFTNIVNTLQGAGGGA